MQVGHHRPDGVRDGGVDAGLRAPHVDAHRHPHDLLHVHEPVEGGTAGSPAAHRCAWSTADCSDWM